MAKGRIAGLVIAVSVLVGGYALASAQPALPAVLRELVAVAPAGSGVTVRHLGADPWGSFAAHWEWSIQGADPDVVIVAYRDWFAAHGIPASLEEPGMEDANGDPVSGTSLRTNAGITLHVPPIVGTRETVLRGKAVTVDEELPGDRVIGTLADEVIGPDGTLGSGGR